MWNILGAIGRKVQSWLQPQQPSYTKVPEGLKVTPPATQDPNKLSLVGQPSELSQKVSSVPGLKETINKELGGGGGGGGEQPPYAPNVQNQTVSFGGVTWKGNPGSGWTRVEAPQQAQQTQAATPTPAFDMGALQRKLQEQVSSVGQKVTSGLGNAGSAIKQGGTNLLNAIKSRVQPLPNYKVGAYDENAPTTPETKVASMANPVKGTWGSGEGLLQDRGITESILRKLGFAGSQEPTTFYNPAAAQVGQMGSKVMVSQGGETLPATPPALGGGGGQVLGQFSNIPELNQAIIDTFLSPPTQISQQEVIDLDAQRQQIAQEMGIPEAQASQEVVNKQVMEIGDSLESVEAEVNAEIGSGLVTESQRRRIIDARSKPLREQLAKLVRSAQYLGVNMDNLYKMLNQRMAMKQQTITNQFQAAQLAQNAEEQRKNRLLQLLPYTTPKAQTLKSNTSGGGEKTLQQQMDEL